MSTITDKQEAVIQNNIERLIRNNCSIRDSKVTNIVVDPIDNSGVAVVQVSVSDRKARFHTTWTANIGPRGGIKFEHESRDIF